MASQVEIVNLAYAKLGEMTIQSISEATPQARSASVLWEVTRDSLLVSYPWKFAIKRITLDTPDSEAPEFEYDYQFTLPSDFLKILDIYSSTANYVVENGKLLYSDDSVSFRYIAKITDVSLYPPSFVDALATKLAAELAVKRTGDTNKRTALLQEFQLVISRAYKLDAIEGQQEANRGEKDLSEQDFSWSSTGH